MKAVLMDRTGDADVLELREVARPSPTSGQVLLRIEAAGVNFIDVYHRRGWYPQPLPFTPGQEAAGTVEEVGEGVTNLRPGERVGGAAVTGAYAQFAAVPAERLVRIPEGITTRTAAALLLQGMTAHYLVNSTYPIAHGEWCLIHAAAGGVGLLLCQLARARGARVIGTAGTEEKAARAMRAGANEVILYDHADFGVEVRRITSGKGVSVVYDSVGRATFMKSLDCLAPRGMLVLYGQSSGPVEPFDPQILARKGSLFLSRPVLGHYTATNAELEGRAQELFALVRDGKLDVRIDREFPLADASASHRELESRRTSGKLLLLP